MITEILNLALTFVSFFHFTPAMPGGNGKYDAALALTFVSFFHFTSAISGAV